MLQKPVSSHLWHDFGLKTDSMLLHFMLINGRKKESIQRKERERLEFRIKKQKEDIKMKIIIHFLM